VRAVVIVVVAPCRNQLAGMAQPDEEVLVQAFVTEPAVDGEDGRLRDELLNETPFPSLGHARATLAA
jgi:hypothetical protein